jgi:hypothetical protein
MRAIIAGGRKPKYLPEFNWINTVLGNLKTSLGGAYHAFDFAKYGTRYLDAFVYRFNRRFHLETLPLRLLVATATIGHAQYVGFAKLTNLSNQVKICVIMSI